MPPTAHVALGHREVRDAAQFRRRVGWLAVVYPALCAAALAGIVLIVGWGELFVTLAQRSNVETLTLAFFLVFFAYFAVLSAPGALGALRILRYRLAARLARDRGAVARRLHAALGRPRPEARAALDRVVELADAPGQPWSVEIRDTHGSLGTLAFAGVRLAHEGGAGGGSNALLGFAAAWLRHRTGAPLAIVRWASIDAAAHLAYAAQADALQAIGDALGTRAWPRVVVTAAQRDELARALAELAPALREDALLPDWEYSGEHKLPIIPEPLGIISLGRSEQRVDPLASLTATLAVVLAVLGLLVYFIARPPWVPGH